jgi:hypothetical protein
MDDIGEASFVSGARGQPLLAFQLLQLDDSFALGKNDAATITTLWAIKLS